MPVRRARLLLGVEPAGRRDHGGAEVEARLQPAGVRAEAVRQHRHVEAAEVRPQLVVAEVRVPAQLDGLVLVGEPAQRGAGARRVEVLAGREDLVVDVDLQARAGKVAHDRGERRGHRRHVHVRPQALGVQPDDEALVDGRAMPSRPGRRRAGAAARSRRGPSARRSRRARGVSVITAAACSSRTPSCCSCSPGAGWWGLRRSWTVTTSGTSARSRAPATARSSSGVFASKPKCTWKTSNASWWAAIQPASSIAGGHQPPGTRTPVGRRDVRQAHDPVVAAGIGEVADVHVTRRDGGDTDLTAGPVPGRGNRFDDGNHAWRLSTRASRRNGGGLLVTPSLRQASAFRRRGDLG